MFALDKNAGNRAPRCATARQERCAGCERTNPVIVVNNTWTNQAGQPMSATNGNGPGPFTVNGVMVVNGQVTSVNVSE
jgi:hypothetical protein